MSTGRSGSRPMTWRSASWLHRKCWWYRWVSCTAQAQSRVVCSSKEFPNPPWLKINGPIYFNALHRLTSAVHIVWVFAEVKDFNKYTFTGKKGTRTLKLWVANVQPGFKSWIGLWLQGWQYPAGCWVHYFCPDGHRVLFGLSIGIRFTTSEETFFNAIWNK